MSMCFAVLEVLFTGEAKGPVLGWTAAIGAYCSALFPALFAAFDDKSMCLYIFVVYYFSCLAVNYWCAYSLLKSSPPEFLELEEPTA